MRQFILDVNVPVVSTHDGYPEYFFKDLVNKGAIKLVVGGTNYRKEVKVNGKLVELFGQLISAGRVLSVNDDAVDSAEATLMKKIVEVCDTCPSECDDPHIFALALVSNCPNVITNDHRIASCRNKIRSKVGHDVCANVKVIASEAAYKAVV